MERVRRQASSAGSACWAARAGLALRRWADSMGTACVCVVRLNNTHVAVVLSSVLSRGRVSWRTSGRRRSTTRTENPNRTRPSGRVDALQPFPIAEELVAGGLRRVMRHRCRRCRRLWPTRSARTTCCASRCCELLMQGCGEHDALVDCRFAMGGPAPVLERERENPRVSGERACCTEAMQQSGPANPGASAMRHHRETAEQGLA